MSQTVPAPPETAPASPPPGEKKGVWSVLRGLTWRVKIAFPLVLLGLAFVVYLTGKSATLKLTCMHNIRSGEISVWTDDQLVYFGKLSSTNKKRFGLFGGKTPVLGSKAAPVTFTQSVKVPDGPHRLRIQVVGDGYDQSRTIPVDFGADTQSTVSINALNRSLQVNWKDTHFSPISAETPWYMRYGKAVFITIFGSIVSALMGMVVQEIMGKLRKPART